MHNWDRMLRIRHCHLVEEEIYKYLGHVLGLGHYCTIRLVKWWYAVICCQTLLLFECVSPRLATH